MRTTYVLVDELIDIFKGLCDKEQYVIDDNALGILETYFNKTDRSSFGNGRGVRNLFEKVKEMQANRLVSTSYDENSIMEIKQIDIEIAIKMGKDNGQ